MKEFPCISSRRDPLVREAAALTRSGEKRREEGLFLCEGARLCRDAALSGIRIRHCFFTEQAAEKYGVYLDPVLEAAEEAHRVELPVAALLASTKSSQGIFCVCGLPEPPETEAVSGKSVLVLENLQDPGNLGTVLRTAEALGVSRVILLGDCCDPLSPKVLRASMGAVFRLLPEERKDAGALCGQLKTEGYALHAAVPDGSARPVTEIDFSGGFHAVFIGNEGNGLTGETIARCDDRVTIPMEGRAESLNASAAATILLWEMKREGGIQT